MDFGVPRVALQVVARVDPVPTCRYIVATVNDHLTYTLNKQLETLRQSCHNIRIGAITVVRPKLAPPLPPKAPPKETKGCRAQLAGLSPNTATGICYFALHQIATYKVARGR